MPITLDEAPDHTLHLRRPDEPSGPPPSRSPVRRLPPLEPPRSGPPRFGGRPKPVAVAIVVIAVLALVAALLAWSGSGDGTTTDGGSQAPSTGAVADAPADGAGSGSSVEAQGSEGGEALADPPGPHDGQAPVGVDGDEAPVTTEAEGSSPGADVITDGSLPSSTGPTSPPSSEGSTSTSIVEAPDPPAPSVPSPSVPSPSEPPPSGPSSTSPPRPDPTDGVSTTVPPEPTRPPSTTPPPTAPPTTPVTPPPTAPPTPPPPPPAPPGGQVVWEENFDRLDTSRWAPEHSTYGDGNNELQCYRPENVSVSSGRLVLRAVTETYTCPNGSTRQVTSGMVRSRGLTFEPGQALEFRVKLTPADENDQSGLWPAVWSSGLGPGGWPAGGELDFLEVMTANDPTRSIFSMHYARPNGSHGVTNRPVFGAENFSRNWHTVRFEYGRNGRLVWYLDGQQVFAVDAADTVQGYPAPFDRPIREIKINLALGGRPGPLSPNAVGTRGATFEVDYIRVVTL